MKRQHIFKFGIALLVSFLFSIYALNTVFGATNSIPRYGFLGGVTALATVDAFPTQGNPVNCRITSLTSPGTVINVLGWTWWQCEVFNQQGSIIAVQYGSPAGFPNYGTSRSATLSYSSAPGGAVGYRTKGVHDFNHSGASPSPWQPYNVVTN